MTNKDVSKVKRKGTFKSAPLPVAAHTGEVLAGEALVKVAVAALEDVKAQDIQVIDVRDKHSITDFMIIATGTSNRQIGAMLDKVREAVKAQGVKPLGEEGKGDSDWVLLDMDDVIVHMMTASAVSSTTWSVCGPVLHKAVLKALRITARKTPMSISPSSTKTRNKGSLCACV